jgi:hypothetical protein
MIGLCQNRLLMPVVQAPTVWLDCHRLLRLSAAKAVPSLRSGVGIIFFVPHGAIFLFGSRRRQPYGWNI